MVQHNISFLTVDHLAPLYKEMFPDSKIAKQFKCSRTKTTCILNQAMRPLLRNELTEYMKEQPFALINDGSSDTGLQKMNAVAVQIFDVTRSKKVECKFYDMCVTSGEDSGKAENLFNAIDSTMQKDGVDWDNVVRIGLDNTNSNMGIRNSIKSRILEKNADVFAAGCSCHLAHLAAGAGGRAYEEVIGFDMEDHQVDMFYFFKNSTRRKGILLEYLDFMGQEWENKSRFVKTRWLSLEVCCNKEYKKFSSLKSMFLSRTENSLGIDKGKAAPKEGKSVFKSLRYLVTFLTFRSD